MEAFSDANAKIAWAKTHYKRLVELATEYLDSKPFEVIQKRKRKRFTTTTYIKLTTPPPIDLSLIALDAIHNARTALDYIAYRAAELNGNSPKGVTFPFARSREYFENDKRIQGKLKKIGPPFDALIGRLGPFQEGNRKLWAINQIDNEHKHVRLVDAYLPPKRLEFIPKNPGQHIDIEPWVYVIDSFELGVETPIFQFHDKDLAQVDVSYRLGLSLRVDITGINKDAVSGVYDLIEMAESVVRSFENETVWP